VGSRGKVVGGLEGKEMDIRGELDKGKEAELNEGWVVK